MRFIDQDVGANNSSNLDLRSLGGILNSMSPNGDTAIGINLRSKILQPLVYDKLATKTLKRPLLVSIITEGDPSGEDKDELANAIVECGNRLVEARYPRDSKWNCYPGSCLTDRTNDSNRCEIRDRSPISPILLSYIPLAIPQKSLTARTYLQPSRALSEWTK